jgi:gas vesicle protein
MRHKYDDLPHIVIETEEEGGGFSTFLLGVLLGAGAALLLAPRSGAETQRQLREFATRVRDEAEETVDGARGTVTGLVDRTRGVVEERISALRGEFEARTDQARTAVDAGRRAARQARGELQRRVDDAKSAYRGSTPPPAFREPPPDRVVDEVIVADVTVETDPGDLAR